MPLGAGGELNFRDHGQGPSRRGTLPSESSGFPLISKWVSVPGALKSLAGKGREGASSKLLCPAPLENLELLRRGPEIHNYDNPLMGAFQGRDEGTLLKKVCYLPTHLDGSVLADLWRRRLGAQGMGKQH